MQAIPLKNYTAFCALTTALAAFALLLPAGMMIRPALALIYLISCGALLGVRLMPNEPVFWKVFWGALIYSAAIITAGSAAYYLYGLNTLISGLILIIAPLSMIALYLKKQDPKKLLNARKNDETAEGPDVPGGSRAGTLPYRIIGAVLLISHAALIIYAFTILGSAATDMTIRSPWDVVPQMFFFLFFLAALGTFIISASGTAGRLALAPAAGLMLLATSVAAITYSVGFGFDTFIHQATESFILNHGSMDPKPFYYIGQYATVILTSRLTGLGVVPVDTFLVPVIASLIVPAAYWSIRRSFGWSVPTSLASSMAVFLLPMSSFIMTTPQGFANALLIITSLVALAAITARAVPKTVVLLFAIATTAIHPLAGIPLLIFFCIMAAMTVGKPSRLGSRPVRRAVLGILVLLGSVALPVVFVLNSRLSGTAVQIDTESLRTPSVILEELRSSPAIATRQFEATYDLVYSWRTMRMTILLSLGLLGLYLMRRKGRASVIYGAGFVVLTANYILLKSFIDFPFLIEYERSGYADRISELALFLLVPPILCAAGHAIRRINRSFPSLKIGTAVMVAILATSSLYLAYPRRDKYESSRGWSTSAADVEAVRIIHEDAGGSEYVVLANQSVSAAAIRELGFRHYYRSNDPEHPEDIFFYPVPTGGILYEKYLAMNEAEGSKGAAESAMDLAGVDTAYYVVNHYWWKAQNIIVSAKRGSERHWSIDDKDFVFRYSR